ncbi:hypothetical protein Ancab_011393 [Ancistrocladus abbreviatus]
MEFVTKLQSRLPLSSTSPSPSSSSSSSPSPLSSSSSSFFVPPHKTQLHPRMHPLSLSSSSSSPKSSNNPHKYLFLFISLSLLPFLIYLFSLYRSIHLSTKFIPSNSNIFGLVIDIDDFRSQIRIFQSMNSGFRAQFGEGLDSMSIQPGFSGLVDDSEKAEKLVLELIEFADKRVPKSEWGKTKVQLRVSGDVGRVEFHAEQKVLEKCRRVLRSSGLLFKDDWASILKGQDEGVYAWIAVNYALGNLGGGPEETSGVVELGGTSVQVSFASRESLPQKFSRIIRLAGVTYNLYTQSLLQFGQDAAWKSLHELKNPRDLTSFSLGSERTVTNPCIPNGYELTSNASDVKLLRPPAAGKFSTCRFEVLALLKTRQEKCSRPPCNIMSSFPKNLKQKADLQEGFFYTSKFVGMVPKASLSELEAAGHHFCEDVWDKLKNRHHNVAEMDLLRYCFSHAYMVALLHDSFGIPIDNERVGFSGDAGIIPVDWTLGAFVFQMMSEPLELKMDTEDQIVGTESVTYFLLFAFLLIIVLLATFFVMKLRKPQFKTIYDLEKGRYIITRVPR